MKHLPHPTFAALALVAVACTSTTADEASASDVEGMRAWLHDFGASYRYDVGYLETLLDLSPAAYDVFAGGMAMAERLEHLPLDAYFVGTVGALLADDCGQCTQLNLRLGAEAGVDRDLLRRALEEPEALPPTLRLVHAYATDVVSGRNVSPEAVATLRRELGDEAFAELAVNVLGVRVYPGLRRALGAETACPPPSLDF